MDMLDIYDFCELFGSTNASSPVKHCTVTVTNAFIQKNLEINAAEPNSSCSAILKMLQHKDQCVTVHQRAQRVLLCSSGNMAKQICGNGNNSYCLEQRNRYLELPQITYVDHANHKCEQAIVSQRPTCCLCPGPSRGRNLQLKSSLMRSLDRKNPWLWSFLGIC